MQRLSPSIDTRTALRMTRPGFGAITVAGCLLGFALAHHDGVGVDLDRALVVVLLSLLLHAAANVLNDYQDACSGADAANTSGIFPFTGGARLIQNGVVTPEQTRQLAVWLLLCVVPGGLGLAWQSGLIVVWLGLAGVLLGWAYSAPPLRLMHRGVGELSVGMAWALLVTGSDAVFRGAFYFPSVWLAMGYGALIANILLINAFPDADADASVGKRTAVVRLGPQRAVLLYGLLLLFSQGVWLYAVAQGWLPVSAFAAGLSALTGLDALRLLSRYAHTPEQLRGAIVRTILTALLYAATLVFACL